VKRSLRACPGRKSGRQFCSGVKRNTFSTGVEYG